MSVAKAYAKALFEAAQDAKLSTQDMDRIESQLDDLLRVMNDSKAANVALTAPATGSKEKVAFVTELTTRLSSLPLVRNFLILLARKERFSLLPEIRNAYSEVKLASEGGTLGNLVSAEPLEAADVDDLSKAFSKKLGKKVAFKASTDSSLLAGVKVTVNGVTYDGTLRSQLTQLRDRLVHGSSGNH